MIAVLRLGHRKERDKRVSTHVGLVARAFCADEIVYSGEYDEQLLDSISKVVDDWGGEFVARYEKDWLKLMEEYKAKGFTIVHLTMYGLKLVDLVDEIKEKKNLLIVVGGPKVPVEVYRLADYNISITNQPHSEISGLAIFLDRILDGKEFYTKFKNAKKVIKPSARGKEFIE